MALTTQPATGSRGQIHVGQQSSFNEIVQPDHLICFTSESIAATENVLESEAICGADRGRSLPVRGSLDVAGDINFELAASGFGILMKNALGDYIRVPNADGGYHARVVGTPVSLGAVADLVELAEESPNVFPLTGVLEVTAVYRDTAGALAQQNGIEYTGMNTYEASYAAAASGPGAVQTVTLAQIYDIEGNLVDPVPNATAGIALIGNDRVKCYYSNVGGAPGAVTIDFVTADNAGLGVTVPTIAADDAIILVPALAGTLGVLSSSPELVAGTMLLHSDDEADPALNLYTNVYTHYMERGAFLPPGMTVEVDRDAAIFVYNGMKVGTLTVNFENNAIVTGTFSLQGKAEYAMATLAQDVVPAGVTTSQDILLEAGSANAFPTAGTLTIGERTNIAYTGKTEVDVGGVTYVRLTIPNATAETAIDRFHPKGSNVDSRTSTKAATVYEGDNSSLTAFETIVCIDGAFEEVLAGSLTLNNNLNGDKYPLGSRFKAQIVEERAEVDAQLTMEFDDGKNYNKFIKGEFFALEFKCISEADDSEIGSTGVLSQAYFYLPLCKYTGNTPVIEDDSYITHDMPIIAAPKRTEDTTDLIAIFVNDEQYDVESP